MKQRLYFPLLDVLSTSKGMYPTIVLLHSLEPASTGAIIAVFAGTCIVVLASGPRNQNLHGVSNCQPGILHRRFLPSARSSKKRGRVSNRCSSTCRARNQGIQSQEGGPTEIG